MKGFVLFGYVGLVWINQHKQTNPESGLLHQTLGNIQHDQTNVLGFGYDMFGSGFGMSHAFRMESMADAKVWLC